MKENRSSEIKVGITVIISIIILIWIFGWAKNFDLTSSKQLLIRFDNIAGLEAGDRITVNGIRKGFVEDFQNDGNTVIVKAIMDKDADIREDARFTILMLDLMGGKKIEINPGNSPDQIDYDIVQNGHFSGDISTAMAMLSSVQGDLVEVIKEVKVSLNNINEIITDKEFNKNVKNSFQNINNLSLQLGSLIDENKEGISRLLNSSKELTESANSLINENKEQLNQSLLKMNEFLTNSNHLVKRIDESISEIKNKENNIGKLIYDKQFMKNITETLNEVKQLGRLVKQQLEGEGLNVDANVF